MYFLYERNKINHIRFQQRINYFNKKKQKTHPILIYNDLDSFSIITAFNEAAYANHKHTGKKA